MNGLTPDRLDDFLFTNATEKQTLELILSLKLPFPYAGKSGILFHGTWGTGKSTMTELMPNLLEMAHSGNWNFQANIGQMPAITPAFAFTEIFRCGGGLNSTAISQRINLLNSKNPFFSYAGTDYFVFDEVDRLTVGAQQSLRSVMGLKRCMFFFSTNYLDKIDPAIVNRCHLVEMNQAVNPASYHPLAHQIMQQMGLTLNSISKAQLDAFSKAAKGSLREFINEVVVTGVRLGGKIPAPATVV
jgi:DNA polymerase III delta prime subunit